MPIPTPQRTRKRVLKPHERRELVLRAGRGAAGCTKAVMLLHGFTAEQLTKLVRAGFADTIIERAVGGAQTVLKISAKRVSGRSPVNDDRDARGSAHAPSSFAAQLGLSQKKPHGLYRNHKQRHGDNGQSDGARYDKQKLQTGSYPHPLDNPQIGRKWQLR